MDAYHVDKVNMKDADFADLSREVLKRGDAIRFKAHGPSMLPLIRDGDLLTIKPLEMKDINLGDVVFYQTAGEKCVVHRVVKMNIRDDQCILIMKGDASPGSMEEIGEDRLLGKVVQLHRNERCINLNHNVWWILSRHLPGFLQFCYLIARAQRKFFLNRNWPNRNTDFHPGKE
jgi:signal peptidase I